MKDSLFKSVILARTCTFKELKELLKKALTHTSYAYEHGIESNEKLDL